MRKSNGIVVLVLVGLSAIARSVDGKGQQTATPERQYKALLDQYNNAYEEYAIAFRDAKLPKDREKLIQEKYPRPAEWAPKFFELAEKYSKEPFAEDALIWIVTSDARLRRFLPWHEHTVRYEMIWIIQSRNQAVDDKQEDVSGKASNTLLRNYATSPKMGQVAQNLNRNANSNKLLRAIIEKNPSNEVRAEACLALSREFQADIAVAKQLKNDPQFAKNVQSFYPKEYLQEMQKADLAKLEAEGDKLSAELEKYIEEMKPARLVHLCQELKYSNDSEKLLRLLYEKHSRHEVRGVACLILAQVLNGRAHSLAETDPKGAERLEREIETLLEEAADKYADVEMPLEGTVGKKANGILFDVRHLSIGKAAPEIEGADQDGKQFKLSDYKGKVVLLDFWSEY